MTELTLHALPHASVWTLLDICDSHCANALDAGHSEGMVTATGCAREIFGY
jgi:hypothetical protein